MTIQFNNNWLHGGMGGDLAYERDCQRHIYEAGGFGALGSTNYVRYTPPTNYVGTDTFTFVAFDTLGNSATGTVTVAVLPLSLQFNTSSNIFRRPAQGLQLQVDGARTANPVVIFASTNLLTWGSVFTNTPVLGSIQFTDPAATNLARRFYRAVQ